MSNLDRVFQIFSTGRHQAMSGHWLSFSLDDLQSMAAIYPGRTRQAPLTLGHPKDDKPVLGEVKGLFVKGNGLFAHASVSQRLVDLVREGRYRNRSAAFYHPGHPNSPSPESWALRHVGFLGAAAPAVMGMEALNFADPNAGCICFATECDLERCTQDDAFEFATPPGYQVDTAALPLYRLAQEYRRGCPELSIVESYRLAESTLNPYTTWRLSMKNETQTQGKEALQSRYVRRQSAEQRRNEIKDMLGDTAAQRSSLHQKIVNLDGQLGSIGPEPQFAQSKATIEVQRVQLREQLEEVTTKDQVLRAELNTIERDILPNITQHTGLDEVLGHQAAMADKTDAIQRLEAAIREQTQIIETAAASVAPPAERGMERADLLARLAMGESVQKLIDKLDAEVSTANLAHAESLSKAEPIMAQARQAISGLRRKIDELRAAWAELDKQTPFVLEQYLDSEIAELCAAYVTHAEEIKKVFIRLQAMRQIRVAATGDTRAFIIGNDLNIPAPSILGFRHHGNSEGAMFDGARLMMYGQQAVRDVKDSELNRLRRAGCTLI